MLLSLAPHHLGSCCHGKEVVSNRELLLSKEEHTIFWGWAQWPIPTLSTSTVITWEVIALGCGSGDSEVSVLSKERTWNFRFQRLNIHVIYSHSQLRNIVRSTDLMLHTLPPTTSCHLERKFQLSLSNAESLTIHRYHNAHHVDNLHHAMTTVDMATVGMGFCAHLLKMYVLLSKQSLFITNYPPNDSGP